MRGPLNVAPRPRVIPLMISARSLLVLLALGAAPLRAQGPDTLRLTLATGVLGGFTTYSAFNYETLQYAQAGAWGLAGLNVAATLVGCLAAGAAGVAAGRMLAA